MTTATTSFLAASALAAIIGASAASPASAQITQKQAIEQCKQEVRNTFMQRNRTGQSPNDAMRECVRNKMRIS